MSKPSWDTPVNVTEAILEGIKMQAKGFGLDYENDDNLLRFIEHQAKVISHYSCQCTWLSGIVNSDLNKEE